MKLLLFSCFWTFALQSQNKDVPVKIPVIMLAHERTDDLIDSVRSLLKVKGMQAHDLWIYQDGKDTAVTNVITELQALHAIHHIPNLRTTPPPSSSIAAIASQYKLVLTHFFNTHTDAEAVIVVEDDMQFADDFYVYFQKMYPIWRKDPTLFTISAYNDHGYAPYARDVYAIRRTNVFPGLGWILHRDFWEKFDMAEKWPIDTVWDYWLRELLHNALLECIYPEVSRTKHIGRIGSSSSMVDFDVFFHNHLLATNVRAIDKPENPYKAIASIGIPTDTMTNHASEIRDRQYFNNMRKLLTHHSTPISNLNVLEKKIPPTQHPVVLLYNTSRPKNHRCTPSDGMLPLEEYFALWPTIMGLPVRTSWLGIITVRMFDYLLFIVLDSSPLYKKLTQPSDVPDAYYEAKYSQDRTAEAADVDEEVQGPVAMEVSNNLKKYVLRPNMFDRKDLPVPPYQTPYNTLKRLLDTKDQRLTIQLGYKGRSCDEICNCNNGMVCATHGRVVRSINTCSFVKSQLHSTDELPLPCQTAVFVPKPKSHQIDTKFATYPARSKDGLFVFNAMDENGVVPFQCSAKHPDLARYCPCAAPFNATCPLKFTEEERSPVNLVQLYTQAQQMGETRRYYSGLDCIKDIEDINDQEGQVYTLKGRLLSAVGQHDAALNAYTKGAEISYKEALPRILAAGTHTTLGNYKTAISMYKKLMKQQPAIHTLKNSVGVMYAQMGDLEKAVHYFEMVLEANKTHPSPMTVGNLAMAYQRLGDIEKGVILAQQWVWLDHSALAYSTLGDFYLAKGKKQWRFNALAADQFQRATDTDGKTDAVAYSHMAKALSTIGEYSLASLQHDHAVHFNTRQDPEIWYNLAETNFLIADYAKAADGYRKVVEMGIPHQDCKFPAATETGICNRNSGEVWNKLALSLLYAAGSNNADPTENSRLVLEARRAARQAIASDPEITYFSDDNSYYTLSKIYHFMDELEWVKATLYPLSQRSDLWWNFILGMSNATNYFITQSNWKKAVLSLNQVLEVGLILEEGAMTLMYQNMYRLYTQQFSIEVDSIHRAVQGMDADGSSRHCDKMNKGHLALDPTIKQNMATRILQDVLYCWRVITHQAVSSMVYPVSSENQAILTLHKMNVPTPQNALLYTPTCKQKSEDGQCVWDASQEVPSSQSQVKGAIVYLCCGSREDFWELGRSLHYLWKHYLRKFPYYPIVIFHEGFSDSQKQYLESMLSTGTTIDPQNSDSHHNAVHLIFSKVVFPFVNTTHTHIPKAIGQYGIGYRHMCKFFSGPMFSEESVAQFDWILRLDTDSFLFDDVQYDPFDYVNQQHNQDVVYAYLDSFKDNPLYTEGLYNSSMEYFRNHSIATDKHTAFNQKYSINGEWNDFCFQTHFTLTKRSIWTEGNLLQYFEHLNQTEGFYTQRWGDACVHYLGVTTLYEERQIIKLPFWNYWQKTSVM